MSDKPIVSVIIPNLNSPIIDKAVQSILDQVTDIEFEIIVVGQDAYNRILKDSKVEFIKTRDPTPPAIARNTGVEHSIGDIILFMDADCIANPDLLQKHFNAHQDFGERLIGGSVSFPQEQYWLLCDNISTFHEYFSSLPAGQRKILPTLNLSLKKTSWERIGGFDRGYPHAAGEDADFSYRASRLNIVPYFYPQACVSHQPNRSTFRAIIHHAFILGRYSIKVNPRYYTKQFGSILFRNKILLRLSSPILAASVVFNMLLAERLPFRYWYTLPIVYLLKIVWCFGAAEDMLKK
jgi:glycosyltransferase involved in cell wall biosynthesis